MAPSTQRDRRAPAGGSGRLRIALTMFMRLTRRAENATTPSVSSTPIAKAMITLVSRTEKPMVTSAVAANADAMPSTIA